MELPQIETGKAAGGAGLGGPETKTSVLGLLIVSLQWRLWSTEQEGSQAEPPGVWNSGQTPRCPPLSTVATVGAVRLALGPGTRLWDSASLWSELRLSQ